MRGLPIKVKEHLEKAHDSAILAVEVYNKPAVKFKSVGNGMDFVLSWNFKHIANAYVREKLYEINSKLGLRTPTICTPEELIGGIYE